jgi:hypothetical protein
MLASAERLHQQWRATMTLLTTPTFTRHLLHAIVGQLTMFHLS